MRRILFLSLVPLLALSARAADAGFTLGTPDVAKICNAASSSSNAWLSANVAYSAMAIVAPSTNGVAVSAGTVAGASGVRLTANEAGFAIERTKPEYYLGDMIEPPENVDWTKTYERFLADKPNGFLFDPVGEKVYVTEGGTVRITWVKVDGSTTTMTYITSAACSGRPRRIYWTDEPYYAPAVDLSGKFVKFFGSSELLTPKFAPYTNVVAGVQQELDKRIVSGLVLDSSTHLLNAYGELQGQVVMAYYDTGTYEHMLHVQAVEICRPDVNVMNGEIGRALKPDGRGYDTDGLRAMPTVVSPTDNRGNYLYQHKGQYSYSPKSGNVYPLRPTKDCRWNAEIYWMETDEMEVQWPFELDHYECDWPNDTTVFVRGDMGGDYGRDIYLPTHYSATLMDYQEPEGHARAPSADGTFTTTGAGYSLLKLTADDNIWFVPVHSVMRSDPDFFTLVPEEIAVGKELQLRGGTVAGLSATFAPECDPDSPGYIYEANSSRIWNANLYTAPTASSAGGTQFTASSSSSSSEDGTNTYASVIYAVTANSPSNSQLSTPNSQLSTLNSQLSTIEVWWNTTIKEDGMAEAVTIPTLPQVYTVRWPEKGETPQIVIASQLGSACESTFMHNNALFLSKGESWAQLAERIYFSAEEGTVMFWMRGIRDTMDGAASLLTLAADKKTIVFDWQPQGAQTNLVASVGSVELPSEHRVEFTRTPVAPNEWHNVALSISNTTAKLYIDGNLAGSVQDTAYLISFLGSMVDARIGATDAAATSATLPARQGVEIGEIVFLNGALDEVGVREEMYKSHDGSENAVTGCYSILEGTDLNVTSDEYRTLFDKVLDIPYRAYDCLRDENGPPARGTFKFNADSGTTPKVYVQNDSAKDGYNPNEEHAFVQSGGDDGYVAWALRSDLNTAESSEPGVLVEYVRDGKKRMQYFGVVLTNDVYTALADDCVAGKAIPGPHPLDIFDDPWKPETYWDEIGATTPAHRDRKGQLWARAAGTLNVHMYYPMKEGFAFPSIAQSAWPAVGESVPWLSLLDESVAPANVLVAKPAAWKWNVEWPEEVPEMEIGRTLTVAASGLPEVWNAKSVGLVWPATDEERDATAVLFDPTVAQKAGFPESTYASVAAAVADLGIKQGAGGNATLRKGKWTFDGLPPSIASRFYLDTTADVTECLRLIGEQEDNAGGVSLLHVNVLNEEERKALEEILDSTASDAGKKAWRAAIAALATAPVKPSPHRSVSVSEDVIDYIPRDHYALFSMGATNYVTIIENDATNALMNVADGDPINMHVIKIVPKYYVGRVVTREDPLNLLSQQLSVIYAEAFAGKPEDYIFEWRYRTPPSDGSVPTDFEGGRYELKFPESAGRTRFTIGGQGDTLANMVNTYYAMRYKAVEGTAAYKVMGDNWSEWTDPPALAEGWVQRVLNNVTPFTQRMRDLYENEAETAITMIRQAGAPYEGDVALNQDNLTSVGLIQLYETILSKAESMSLQLEINDADANKQLQLAVARLADLYNLLGDEAYSDALNPTIGFGSSFNSDQGYFSTDYGALSSALFCFDNQVPTLLDEELALLRGRSAANAPSTHLSPYYNRLVWNFTRGMNAGEVAYAVNYDISGNNKGVIDYSQAAEMYPQGHGDAYGHYLSALSGYYRLLRNPYFSWGAPAMGEMVVADSVLNVDYYDEAQFAKAAQNVAKTALDVVDRTARKAYRDNDGATGAGYVDKEIGRNFGYGEWASRGGFGALCNWAVGNSLLEAEPSAGRYWRYAFSPLDSRIGVELDEGDAADFEKNGTWTLEFQAVPAKEQSSSWATLMTVLDKTAIFEFALDEENTLGLITASIDTVVYTNTTYSFAYTNNTYSVTNRGAYAYFTVTNGHNIIEYQFLGDGVPNGVVVVDNSTDDEFIPPQPADMSGLGWHIANSKDDKGEYVPYIYSEEMIEYMPSSMDFTKQNNIAKLRGGENSLVAMRCSGADATISVFDSTGALVAEKTVDFPRSVMAREVYLGGDYEGEIGEVRLWDGVRRSNAELLAKREYVSPLAAGLALYLRTFSDSANVAFIADEAVSDAYWNIEGGKWISAHESGMAISFEDEGLKRIDRGTVSELSSLAAIVPQIQKKVDQMDAGLNPLGLSEGAIPFDLDPYGEGGGKSHYEQIRARAGIALANARKTLEKAQTSANRMRLLQESQTYIEDSLEEMELEFKNKLIEYFGYPYEGDIGAGGTYAQGYDGPDLLHYLWMDLADYGASSINDKKEAEIVWYKGAAAFGNWMPNLDGFDDIDETTTNVFVKSAIGVVLKPDNISGKRRANGKIQDALGEFIMAYSSFDRSIESYKYATEQFKYEMATTRSKAIRDAIMAAAKSVDFGFDLAESISEAAIKMAVNSLEITKDLMWTTYKNLVEATPHVVGAGMTVNTDPSAITAAATSPVMMAAMTSQQGILLANKNALAAFDTADRIREIAMHVLETANETLDNLDDYYQRMRSAAEDQYDAAVAVGGKWKALQVAQKAVETVCAEAERIIDERTLQRTQAVDKLTKMRYNEMFFRINRDSALSRYSSMFDLAQKYAYLAAQAYDYETGLLSSDEASGEKFIAEIVGARTLGEFDSAGEPMVTSGDGDGGLADILARLDQNWLVLKPRLGINNPQPYATWFSLRKELFRIYGDERGDKAWKTELKKKVVENLNEIAEFKHYCQPLSGSTAEKEPGLVIEFPSEIVYGYNFFGNETVGGDSPLDSTWYATHISAAGVHFEGYDDATLAKTPTAYLVPVGEDRMRAVGNQDTVLSWKVVDQTIPAPYAIGSTELDNPDWTPLYNGITGGNDLGARIRRHPAFRAYYGEKGMTPNDSELDCTRLVGRSAWNTRWLLIIPAGQMNSSRDDAIDAFIDSVSDIKLGLKTYSASGN